MTFDEWKILVKGLKSVYTKENFLPDGDSIKVWYGFLMDIPYKELNIAVQKHILTSKFPPTIMELRDLATNTESKDWGEGWKQVKSAISRYGFNYNKAIESMDEITRECVRRIGYKEICESENVAVERANFRMIYQELAERKREEKRLTEPLRKLGSEEVKKIGGRTENE